MAKVRRSRRKFHLPAVKPNEKEKTDPLIPNESTLPAIFPVDGLFNPNKVIRSGTTDSHEVQKLQVNKKDKRKERHERFLRKLNAARHVEESSKKANKRSKTVVVGDMEPLLSALPTINVSELIRGAKSPDNSNGNEKTTSKKSKMGKRARQTLQASEIAHFQQVLKHPAFKANPLGAISEHIKNAVQKELENAT